ncbi:MAG: orotate phosphoribosyltransferase [Leptospiraceae bacterium]|nr:orotate phosphoribosyltransferase [Leptospiraceae bacterium]
MYRYDPAGFTLTSGKFSHHYFNCKQITMVPAQLRRLALAIRDEIFPTLPAEPVALGGLTLGADPIALAVSLAYAEQERTIYPIIVRKAAKQHGTGKQIEYEGPDHPDGATILIDDVVTTGGSSIVALHALRSAGFQVNHALCIVDREEGGREALAAENVELISLFLKSDFGAGA